HTSDRAPRMIGAHRHEERRDDVEPLEQREEPRDTFLQSPARVDVDAERYWRLNHSIVRASPSSSGPSPRTPRSSRMRLTDGARRGMSSYPRSYTASFGTRVTREVEPEILIIISASRTIDNSRSVPTLIAMPSASGLRPAATVARTASSM